MKVDRIKYSGIDIDVISYKSIQEFYNYLISTPINKSFRWEELKSVKNGYSFTGTESFDEAVDLLKNGYKEGSSKLQKRLKVEETKMALVTKRKTVYGVQGYQPCVPLYLNGVPTNMITTVNKPVKQKIVVLNKDISYNASFTKEEIEEESIKAFRIIRKLESQGYRCELNGVLGTSERFKSNPRAFACRVRIKSADERLNISKMAFPLIHPSMLRRLYFRFIEVYPEVTKSFTSGYGSPLSSDTLRELYDGYLLPKKIDIDVDKIRSIDDLKNI